MVATDIAARGIDVEGISHVINFDVPSFAEDYLHRIGRTGRATAKGDAITFVSHEEDKHFHQIERFIGRKLPMEKCPAFVGSKPEIMPRPQSVDNTHRPPSRTGGGRPVAGKKRGGFQGWRRKRFAR
jgi:superfamily II DNA/RNA helicase